MLMRGLAAALMLGAGTFGAVAADLGGSCCADLEERIAELEATTVRKGNRKVKLTISGIVHKGVLYHDVDGLPGDGKLSVYDGTTDPSRIRLDGEAKMSGAWAAGFAIEIAWAGNTARGADIGKALFAIDGADGKNEFQIGEAGTTIRHSYAWLSGPMGKLSIGQQSTATDGVIEVNTSNSYIAGRPLQLGPMNFGGALAGLVIPYDGGRAQALRYDSPTIGGFMASAAWQDTDSWDAALRWAGEFSGVRLAAGIGYREQQSQTLINVVNLIDLLKLDVAGAHKSVAGSVSAMHVPTGVFINAAYSQVKYDLTGELAVLPPLFSASFDLGREKAVGMSVQMGVERNFFGVGATTLFAEYQRSKGDTFFVDTKSVGVGAVQSFDALATDVYFSLRKYTTPDLDPAAICVGLCSDATVATGGVRIKF